MLFRSKTAESKEKEEFKKLNAIVDNKYRKLGLKIDDSDWNEDISGGNKEVYENLVGPFLELLKNNNNSII